MSYGQTNGIPQGSTLMDFIAEIILGYVDYNLTIRLVELNIDDYKILRYRDDYRIFTNDSFAGELIAKELSEILSGLGMKLNAEKTKASRNIVKSSLKPDKLYWINNKRVAGDKQKWLIQLYLLSEKFPNSGTVDTQMREFLKVLSKSKKKDSNIVTLISLVTEITLRNPRVVPTAIAILGELISQIEDTAQKQKLVNKIKSKFREVPNSSLLMIWFQRLNLTINKSEQYVEKLCRKVVHPKEAVWNNSWLQPRLGKFINESYIVDEKEVKNLTSELSKKEIKKITTKKRYY